MFFKKDNTQFLGDVTNTTYLDSTSILYKPFLKNLVKSEILSFLKDLQINNVFIDEIYKIFVPTVSIDSLVIYNNQLKYFQNKYITSINIQTPFDDNYINYRLFESPLLYTNIQFNMFEEDIKIPILFIAKTNTTIDISAYSIQKSFIPDNQYIQIKKSYLLTPFEKYCISLGYNVVYFGSIVFAMPMYYFPLAMTIDDFLKKVTNN